MKNIGSFSRLAEFANYINSIGVTLPFEEVVESDPDAPFAKPYFLNDKIIGNRFAILPMEGADSTLEGNPTDLTMRRWERFGLSGAKLIFGGETFAVRQDGRSSPHQLIISKQNLGEITKLREVLVRTHKKHFSNINDLLVGIQLTHSGRMSRPYDMERREPKILYHHPILDQRYGVTDDTPLMTDEEIEHLIEDFINAAKLSQQAGYDFVDIKHCHGYLGHEFLSAVDRPGRYGGSFENRTRFLREIVTGIRAEAPGLDIAVRLSAFDTIPFQQGVKHDEPMTFNGERYPYAFGGDGTGLGMDLTEPLAFLDLLVKIKIKLLCISAGADYNTHIMEPYISAPITHNQPPEDPLVGVARLISIVAELKRKRPELIYVGSGYSYLQQWLPNVAQYVIRNGMADFVGIGRMALCYPDIVTDILAGRSLKRNLLCRTCSYCDAAQVYGISSGCYLIDDFYRNSPEFQQLRKLEEKK